MANAERTEPVIMIGPKGLFNIVRSLRCIAPELPFELRFIELDQNTEQYRLGPFEIRCFKVKHNITCYGYSVMLDRSGRFDAERAKAADIPLKFWNPLQKGNTVTDPQTGRTFTPDMVLGAARKGLKVTYVTDTRPTASILENAAGSDLFICEGMYGEKEKLANAKEHRHMMIDEAAQIARDAGVKEMWLTHYSPALAHPEEFEKDAKKIFPNTVLGRDGLSTELGFEES